MKYYLFRHGETYFSKNLIPYGKNQLTANITPEAVTVVEKMAIYLNKQSINLALRSEFLRCKETADVIEKNTDIRFEVEPLANEFVEEEFSLFRKRMEMLVGRLHSLNADTIALCTHGAVVSALQKMLLNKSFVSSDLVNYPDTGVIVKIDGDSREEIDFRS